MTGLGRLSCAAVALAVLALAAWPGRGDFAYGLVSWCLAQPGGFLPVRLLKVLAFFLDDEELYEGRGLAVPASLAGKVALVTGSSQGIGFEAARLFHGLGAHVVISGRSQASCDARAAMLPAEGPGKATGMRLDLEDFEDVRRFAAAVSADFQGVDYLVLNAAMSATREPPHASKSGHDRSYAANYLSNYLLARLLLPKLNPGGSVVLVSSIVMWGAVYDFLMPPAGRVPWEEHPELDVYQQYQVAKLALCVCFRDSLRERLHSKGVRVNSMVPGFIVTNMTEGVWRSPLYSAESDFFWLAPAEAGGRLLFQSAFATPLPPDHDFLYAFWVPSQIFRKVRAQALWQWRVAISGFFTATQMYQRLYGMRLHSSVSPECEGATRRALWAWTANATGLPE